MIECRCVCGWPIVSDRPRHIRCRSCGNLVACGDAESHARRRVRPSAVPADKWPTWATAIAAHAVPGEVGVGDTTKRLIEASGLDTLATIASWLGVPCGCEGRHQRWNKRYKY